MKVSPLADIREFLMVNTPNIYCLVKGAAEARMKLNAFDKALLNAGVGDTNLVRMSSILPPGARQVDSVDLPPGSLVPLAYASIESDKPGEVISSAIAVGIPENEEEPGVIMEFEDHNALDHVEATVKQMVTDAFEYRNRRLKEIKAIGIEHTVEQCGAAFAAAVIWYE